MSALPGAFMRETLRPLSAQWGGRGCLATFYLRETFTAANSHLWTEKQGRRLVPRTVDAQHGILNISYKRELGQRQCSIPFLCPLSPGETGVPLGCLILLHDGPNPTSPLTKTFFGIPFQIHPKIKRK
jgi:hypothetical protein